MKYTSFKRKIQVWYPRGRLLALAVCFLLTSASLVRAADTSIAFMSKRSGNGEIYRMSSDGKRVRRLTKHPQYDAVPAWSPDGQKITFMSFRDQNRIQNPGIILGEIYLMNADGTNPINLTNHPAIDRGPSWGPAPTLSVSLKGKLATLWGEVKRAR